MRLAACPHFVFDCERGLRPTHSRWLLAGAVAWNGVRDPPCVVFWLGLVNQSATTSNSVVVDVEPTTGPTSSRWTQLRWSQRKQWNARRRGV
jgi:hypothetical protein